MVQTCLISRERSSTSNVLGLLWSRWASKRSLSTLGIFTFTLREPVTYTSTGVHTQQYIQVHVTWACHITRHWSTYTAVHSGSCYVSLLHTQALEYIHSSTFRFMLHEPVTYTRHWSTYIAVHSGSCYVSLSHTQALEYIHSSTFRFTLCKPVTYTRHWSTVSLFQCFISSAWLSW